MAKLEDSILQGLSGRVGNLVFYKLNGKTYVRKAPKKQSKAVKAKTSPLKRASQAVNKQTHAFLKNFTHLLRFGFQEFEDGGRKAYHAAVSYTSKNCFSYIENSPTKELDLRLVKFSRGTLLGAIDSQAQRIEMEYYLLGKTIPGRQVPNLQIRHI